VEDIILKIKNLNKSYHSKDGETKAVDNFTFDLKDGEFIAIVGPSGCGKSTILNIISSLTDIDKGEVSINGNVGYMFQNDNLFEWRNIYRNITLGLEIKGKVKKEDREKILKLLDKYGLKEFKDKHPSELSG